MDSPWGLSIVKGFSRGVIYGGAGGHMGVIHGGGLYTVVETWTSYSTLAVMAGKLSY